MRDRIHGRDHVTDPGALARAAELLATARRVMVLTGAGVSAESGVPTFRDEAGVWSTTSPENVATPAAFARDPARVWAWYRGRAERMAAVAPNSGHRALADLEARVERLWLVTQNIDGLHGRAGSRTVIELHGRLDRIRCSREGTVVDAWDDADGTPPRCAACGAYLRPDVVWFGEALPRRALEEAWEAAELCDVALSVGTSAVVEPAASLPRVAVANGAALVEVNPERTPLTRLADVRLAAPAAVVLPRLVAAAFPGRHTSPTRR